MKRFIKNNLVFLIVMLLALVVATVLLVLVIFMLATRAADGARLKHYARSLFDWRYDRAAGRAALPPKEAERVRVPFGIAIAAGLWLVLLYRCVKGWL